MILSSILKMMFDVMVYPRTDSYKHSHAEYCDQKFCQKRILRTFRHRFSFSHWRKELIVLRNRSCSVVKTIRDTSCQENRQR
jgi:hypothetical protein